MLPTWGPSDCYSESIKTLQSTDWKPLIWSCYHFPEGKTECHKGWCICQSWWLDVWGSRAYKLGLLTLALARIEHLLSPSRSGSVCCWLQIKKQFMSSSGESTKCKFKLSFNLPFFIKWGPLAECYLSVWYWTSQGDRPCIWHRKQRSLHYFKKANWLSKCFQMMFTCVKFSRKC